MPQLQDVVSLINARGTTEEVVRMLELNLEPDRLMKSPQQVAQELQFLAQQQQMLAQAAQAAGQGGAGAPGNQAVIQGMGDIAGQVVA